MSSSRILSGIPNGVSIDDTVSIGLMATEAEGRTCAPLDAAALE
jgi:hypothetical protein